MSLTQKLFSFDGRIRRRDWWLLGIGVGIVGYILQQVVYAALGFNPMAMAAGGTIDPGSARTALIAGAIIGLIFLWPSAALSVKRAHDRNMGAIVVFAFYALYALLILAGAWFGMQAFTSGALAGGGAAATPEAMGMASVAGGGMVLGILGIVVAIYAIVLLVMLGFLDGTPGPNQHGPSPKMVEQGTPAAY